MCKRIIASEFVSSGHPDKIADQISDAILDEFIKKDPNVRAGIETLVKDNVVVVGGEVNSTTSIDYDATIRKVFAELPFTKEHRLAPDEIKIINLIGKQSPEIHSGVDKSEKIIGAGDQGFVCGYASNDTDVYTPLGHYLAKKICQYVSSQTALKFGPDTKSQVIVEYDDETNESKVLSILVSTMQQGNVVVDRTVISNLIHSNTVGIDSVVFDKYLKDKKIPIDVNPCGSWKIGGPVSDCGVTGRKIVVDQYGGYCNVGGGAYSGKDATKVDRSAAYMARYIAKNIVASGLCNNCKVELSYMIGIPEPSSVNIEMDINCYMVPTIKKWIKNNLDLTPYGIITRFDAFRPIYYYTAKDGHFGYNDEENVNIRPWEKLDIYEDIAEYCKTCKCCK